MAHKPGAHPLDQTRVKLTRVKQSIRTQSKTSPLWSSLYHPAV